MGFTVDVVLETSHNRHSKGHTDLYREHIDLPVLKSVLWEYEDLLLNDGCTGLAVLNPDVPHEIQFDEHKLLIVYGDQLKEFEKVFGQRAIGCDEQLRFITEAEHVHSSSDVYAQQFEELRTRLGMDDDYAARARGGRLGTRREQARDVVRATTDPVRAASKYRQQLSSRGGHRTAAPCCSRCRSVR